MVDSEIIISFFDFLNRNNLKYTLIKNDDEVLPYSLESDNDIDFLIHPSDYDRLISLAKENGYEKLIGESCKKYFLEQLKEDILLKDKDCYFHFYELLSCTPLTNMGDCKIPLDSKVQAYIWEHRRWDGINNWWIMDDISILLYLIVRSVFDKKEFRAKYIREIEKRINYIHNQEFVELANTVFFGFTSKLVELIGNKQYEHVLASYISYKEY